jgi:6-phosphogluconolactonase
MGRHLRIEYFVEPTPQLLARRAAEQITCAIEEAVASHGRARIAISGGSTPRETYRLLADSSEPWRSRIPPDKLDLYWVDERVVPPHHAASNYRMVCEAWLDHVPIDPGRIHRIAGEQEPQAAAIRYESELRSSFGLGESDFPRFDLVTLGMGADGHTASLFPFTAALNERNRLAVANYLPQQQAWRITLTLPVINQAASVFFLVSGADKAEILKEVMTGAADPERFPGQLIKPASCILTVLMDQAAASLLPATNAHSYGFVEREG